MEPFPDNKNESAALRGGKTARSHFLRECVAWMPASATVTWRHVDRHSGIIIVDVISRASRGRTARRARKSLHGSRADFFFVSQYLEGIQ